MSAAAAEGARVLLVEDEPNMARTLAKILERKGYDVATMANGREALGAVAERAFDVVVTDLNMPVMDGMALLRRLQPDPPPPPGERRLLSPPTIVLTGHGSTQAAVEAMKLGAWDYLVKPCNPDELLMTIEQVLRVASLERENRRLREVIERSQGFGEIIGQSVAMRGLYQAIDALAQNTTTVLITGESGTGKELVARSIHQRSARAERPFVALNCGAVSDTLLDSQLFGHRRGAFTGAVADHEGVFQAAHGGTLFLDEIADIPAALQVKFLRAIQEREVTPLGTTRPLKIDVRLIAATNRDLVAEVQAGAFRSDLYYRLNVVHLPLPPLRERREDVALLARHFVERYARQFNVAPKAIQPAALALLERYDWPGNIRELENVIERCFALAPSDDITPASLGHLVAAPPAPSGDGLDFGSAVPSLEATERQLIAAALRQAKGNKNRTARLLGIDRQRLYRKIEKYGLD
ncbi:MAG: sigma-54-dependent Fis family transcriptional regulator [Deltaproteobacteria bacterium]|nr:sigma-54-dependent Fis family transcriptional regulator [Deltaproteobacteria bacterium]